jgi:alkylhydroperoxidase/carboxymuconolactone decarboxylase family protein YurZ
MALTARQQQIKDEFIAVRGTWSTAFDAVLELDAEFVAAYLEWAAVPVRKQHLEPKVRELIFIAADAAATHLYEPGIRQHVRAALHLGASPVEVMEVLELTSTLGIHACNIGIPLLIEVLTEEGKRTGPPHCRRSRRSSRPSSPPAAATGTSSGTDCSSLTRSCSPRTWTSPRCRGGPACWRPS